MSRAPSSSSAPVATAPTLDETIASIRGEFPDFAILPKEGDALQRAIDLGLRIVTLGGQRSYMTHYHTVLGYTLYVPEAWERTPELDRVITLRHERVHLRQRRRYGMLGMALLYMLPILPMGLALGRARIEWEAYTETIRATAELRGLDAAKSPALRERIVSQFSSAAYGWMWPFRSQVERWYDAVIDELEAEDGPSFRSGLAP